MVQYRRIGYGLIALGVVLSTFPFLGVFGGSYTLVACPKIESIVYDAIRIHPAGFAVTSVDWSNLEMVWYDGCNIRWSPLHPLILGIGSIIAGIIAFGRTTLISNNKNG